MNITAFLSSLLIFAWGCIFTLGMLALNKLTRIKNSLNETKKEFQEIMYELQEILIYIKINK